MARRLGRYRTAALLTGLIVLGWIWDLALGGGRTHALAWLGALIVVGGISLLAARGAVEPVRRPPPAAPARRVVIGPAVAADLPHLVEVEVAADTLFEVAGYGSTPGPASVEELSTARLLLVARLQLTEPKATEPKATEPNPADPKLTDPKLTDPGPDEPPVGYARVEVVDGQAHLEGLSVRPRQMRRGIGTALVTAACRWAAEQGFSQITLCTFADVPWNGPFYAGLGFTEVPAATPGLQALRRHERELGLDSMGRRCVMRRLLTPPPTAQNPASSQTG